VEEPNHNWVNKYLRSVKYSIKQNEGGGDCFFAALRDGLRTVKIETSVKAIREKLANEVDETVFNNYLEFFKLFYSGMKQSQTLLKEFKNKHNTIDWLLYSNDYLMLKALLPQWFQMLFRFYI
jgi:hypothetical protein